ncbi:MAG TPA: hypothetical protein VFQ86_04785, partial [Arachidicoccus soli]|nr:hypothetical protein [Arachidicoccus soli]
TDLKIMLILMRGEFNINGFSSKNLKKWMPNKSSSQISRILKRLRVLGLIKKVNNVYKYYVTVLGKAAIATGLKIKNIVIIPQLDYVTA